MAPKDPVKSTCTTSYGLRQAADDADPKTSPADVKRDAQSAIPSLLQSNDHSVRGDALQDLASPPQDPWRASPLRTRSTGAELPCRESPHPHPSPMIPPPLSRQGLNVLVTTPTHNGWQETPDKTRSLTHTAQVRVNSYRSATSAHRPTSFVERLEAVRSSSIVSPRTDVAPDRSGSVPSLDSIVRGSDLPDPFVNDRSEALIGADVFTANTSHVGITTPPRLSSNGDRYNDRPRTPMPRLQRNFINDQGESPNVRAAERYPKHKPSSPANIEGGYEYIDARDATYGGHVSAESAGSPWANNPRSFAQLPTPKVELSTTANDNGQRRRHRVEAPVMTAEHSSAANAPLEVDVEDDVPLPLRFAGYQGTPEVEKSKKKKKQSKGGASSAMIGGSLGDCVSP